jgi:hypothetical protein
MIDLTDHIKDRFDGCHMGRHGLVEHATAWQAVLRRAHRHASWTRHIAD